MTEGRCAHLAGVGAPPGGAGAEAGRPSPTRPERKRLTSFAYTRFDLLAARTYPDGARYEFVHDAALRLTKVTAPHGLHWSYTYDAAGRLTAGPTSTAVLSSTVATRRDR